MKTLALILGLAAVSTGAAYVGHAAADRAAGQQSGQQSGQQPDQQLYTASSERGSAFALWYGDGKSDGFVNVDFGRPEWKDDYTKALEAGKLDGRRWRLGTNFWTQLDTNLTLTFGDQKVAAGQYYLVMERVKAGDVRLYFLDAATARQSKQVPFLAEQTTGGIAVPVAHSKADAKAERLTLALETLDAEAGRVALRVHFGEHLFTAEFTMKP